MKRRPEEEEEDDYIVKKIGNGSFNVAFLTKAGTVLRLAAFSDDEMVQMRRSNVLTEYISNNAKIFGPSTLIQVKPVRQPLDSDRRQMKLKKMFEENPDSRYYLSELEYLSGGMIRKNKEPTIGGTFSLIYWLWTVQAHIGFRHRDIADDNILIREYKQPQIFQFNVGDLQFKFKMRQVPVVTDFDFGSVPTTLDERRRHSKHTPKMFYGPPECLIPALERRLKQEVTMNVDPKEMYDWWSLGLVIFDWWTRDSVQIQNAADILKVGKLEDDEDLSTLVEALSRDWIIYNLLNFKEEPEVFPNHLLDTEKLKELAQKFSNVTRSIPGYIINILRAMLAWPPDEELRHQRGDGYAILTQFVAEKDTEVKGEPNEIFNYSRIKTYDFRSQFDQEFIKRRIRLFKSHEYLEKKHFLL